jgi:polysaccharide pyruvyl transferase WcaK-like protein
LGQNVLAHGGTFDVANYGDLLFPLVLQRRLQGTLVTHFSPSGGPPVWSDCVASRRFESLCDTPLTGIMIGGGNIIHPMPSKLPDYMRNGDDLTGYGDLWICSALSAAPETPVIWNAPGVPDRFETEFIDIVRRALLRADYLSVRDAESRDCLTEIAPELDIAIVPDSAWDLPGLWTAQELETVLAAALARVGGSPGEPLVSIHVNARYMKGRTVDQVAAVIDRLAGVVGGRPVLLAIGPCHGDDETARDIAGRCTSSPLVVDRPEGLAEIAAIIRGSKFYIGSSMHGYLTAAAFGVPAVAVASGKRKFDGLVRLTKAPETLTDDWDEAVAIVGGMAPDDLTQRFKRASRDAVAILDVHWERIAGLLRDTTPRVPSLTGFLGARGDLLDAMTRHGRRRTKELEELLRRAVVPPSAGKAPPQTSVAQKSADAERLLAGKGYDYIDFGCSKGGSLAYGAKVLGGVRGIGLDVSASKVEQTRAAGYDAAQVDVTTLALLPDCARFVTMIDFLEHLPGYDLAAECIRAACTAATDFVFIRQPWFDSDGALLRGGQKLYWSDWRGHTNTMSSLQLHRAVSRIAKVKRFRLYARGPILDSSDAAVHPLSSPPDQHDWTAEAHPAKKNETFAMPVYRQVGCIAVMKDDPDLLTRLEASTKWSALLYDSKAKPQKAAAAPHVS